MSRSRSTGAAALMLLLWPVVACVDDDAPNTGDGALSVAAAFSPIEELVRRSGGDLIDVVTLVPPGEEAHEYEPTPKQVSALAGADVVFYLGGGFQPGVERAIELLPDSVDKVDLRVGLTMLRISESATAAEDPHVWLDPANMATMARTVEATLAALAPASAAEFRTSTDAYVTELGALDASIAAGLADCETRLLVTAHRAFAYLAAAYDLSQLPIAGISPGEEPSARDLETIASVARENGATTIFFEENLPIDLARTVAEEVGALTAVLDPIESLSRDQLASGATYLTLMEGNLQTLRAGLRCP